MYILLLSLLNLSHAQDTKTEFVLHRNNRIPPQYDIPADKKYCQDLQMVNLPMVKDVERSNSDMSIVLPIVYLFVVNIANSARE